MSLSFHDYETFLLSNQGIVLFHGWILLIALVSAVFFLVKKPRGVWARGFLLTGGLLLVQSVGLAADLAAPLWNSPAISAVFADIDRALELLALSGLVWFFLFPRRNKSGDALTAVWIALILVAAGGSALYLLYLAPAEGAFNSNLLSFIWDLTRWIYLFIALVLTAVRRPGGWGLSFLSVLAFLAGVTLQLAFGDGSTNLPGLARLCGLLAFPLAAMRLAYSAPAGGAPIYAGSPARQVRQAVAESLPSLSDLMLTLQPQDLPQAITGWVCNAMRAEAAYFVASTEKGDGVEFISGYDQVNAQALPGFTLTSEAIPQLHFAVTGRQIMRLGKREAEQSLQGVAAKAQLTQTGPALYAPLPLGDEAAMGILLLAAYSGEEWLEEDEAVARAFAQACSSALQQMHGRNLAEEDLEEAQKENARLQEESERLQAERMNLETRLEQAEQEWRQERERAEGLAALVKEQDAAAAKDISLPEPGTEAEKQWMLAVQQKDGWIARLQEELETTRSELLAAQREAAQFKEAATTSDAVRDENRRLKEEVQQIETMTGAVPAGGDAFAGVEITRLRNALEESEKKYQQEVTRIQNELRKTLTEYAHLQSALLQPPPPAEGGKKLTFAADVGMVTGLIAEIRQPFSSMVGYTDLLLSESAGILGAMQRKFLDRIRASITRTEALFEDLLQLLLLPEKIAAPRMQPVDVASVIDSAITGASEIVREKNLVLRLDVDEEMPPIEVDRDALQQILNHLVQNAVLITPPEKEVVLTTHTPLAEQNQQLALLITVKDSGPGIPAEDQPRVFTRLYRTEGPLIEGLGDTGVGMAVVRTLTEAMGGRIWLESQIGHGTTFFILLPVQVGQTLPSENPNPEGAA
jgi:signal transduction histidine kinase